MMSRGDMWFSGVLASTETVRYPAPSITEATLRVNQSAVVLSGGIADVLMGGNEKSVWLTFQGTHFGQHPKNPEANHSNHSNTSNHTLTLIPLITLPTPPSPIVSLLQPYP